MARPGSTTVDPTAVAEAASAEVQRVERAFSGAENSNKAQRHIIMVDARDRV